MKKRIFVRGVCLLCAFLCIFMHVSCTKGELEDEKKDRRRLTVETLDVTYGEELTRDVAKRAAEIFVRLIRAQRGIVVPEEKRGELEAMLAEKYIPLFAGERVLPAELEKILESAYVLCSAIEDEHMDGAESPLRTRAVAASVFYQSVACAIGTQRAGCVTYEVLCRYFSDRAAYYEERYAEYGYQWYLSDAQTIRRRLTALEAEVGKEVFAEAVSIFGFSSSLCAGIIPTTGLSDQTVLCDGDIKAALERQTEYYISLGITEYQWYVTGDFLSLLLWDSSAEELIGATATELSEEGFFASGAMCMLKLLELYKVFAKSISTEQIALLRSEISKEQHSRTVCEVLAECKDELSVVLCAIDDNCADKNGECGGLITGEATVEAYQRFCRENPALSSQELIAAIEAYAKGETEYSLIRRSAVGYAVGISPYLAFAMSYTEIES